MRAATAAHPASVYFCSLKSSEDIRRVVVDDGFGACRCTGTIRCWPCAKNEELNPPTPTRVPGAAGEKASVESALKAVAADSMAKTAERCLFKIIMVLCVLVAFRRSFCSNACRSVGDAGFGVGVPVRVGSIG